MMTREEIKEDFRLQNMSLGFITFSFIEHILDSIGSCGECKYYANKTCYNEDSISFGGSNAVYEDDYCKDFTRKDT